jgi:serine/threonine protein kinase
VYCFHGQIFARWLTLHATGIPGYLVAIKQLKSTEASALEELTREAAFMAQLNHDNVVKLHGVVTVGTFAEWKVKVVP